MEENIQERLITKCQQLTDGWGARAVNVVAWLTKDIDGRLLPLLNGTADVLRIPQCGQQTAIKIEELLTHLRPYYEDLLQNPTAGNITDEVLHTQQDVMQFRFSEQSLPMERRIQARFEKMADAVSNKRAKNLIHNHLKRYRDAEPFLNDISAVWRWYGVGKQTVTYIQQFLDDFLKEYLKMTDSAENDMDNEDLDSSLQLDLDYPFLTDSEQKFVSTFWSTEHRYPVFFITLRYLMEATDRPTRTFIRIHGINGKYESLQALATEYGLTFERVRQMSTLKVNTKQVLPVWDLERWAALDFFHSPLLTETNTHWKEVQKLEHVEELSFNAALSILAALRPLEIIALRSDGFKAKPRRGKSETYQQPYVLFAYDKHLTTFPMGRLLKSIGHETMLQRIEDKKCSLPAIAEKYFQPDTDEEQRQQVLDMLRTVLPMFPCVEVHEDTVTFRSNHTNYAEDIYQILKRHGQAMKIDDIYTADRKSVV